MIDRENYSRANKLATLMYMGLTFHVARKRLNGRPWRRYLVLVHAGVAIDEIWNDDITDPVQAVAFFRDKFEHAYPAGSKARLTEELAKVKERGADT